MENIGRLVWLKVKTDGLKRLHPDGGVDKKQNLFTGNKTDVAVGFEFSICLVSWLLEFSVLTKKRAGLGTFFEGLCIFLL